MAKQNPIHKAVERLGSDWIGEQVVRLGDYNGDVETGVPGEFYARQNNGKVIEVINTIAIAPQFDARVRVRRSKFQPNVWKITDALEDYGDPVGAGLIASHHSQHEETGFDRVTLDRKQIKQLSARAAGAFTVQVYGGAVQTAAGIAFVGNELLDLASYVVTSGAKYISIEADDAGDLSLNEGTGFASPNVGTSANVPAPDPGKYPIAYVLLYAGQEEIIDNNIRAILPLPGEGGAPVILFDDTEGEPEDVSTSAPADGSSDFAARRDHVHLYTPAESSGGESHEHRIARWNGSSAQTTFDLPDFAGSVEWLALNGLIEDPFVYTLSLDGSQIVLDTGLASAQNVTASYIVRSI